MHGWWMMQRLRFCHCGFYGDDPCHARVFSMTKQLHFYVIRNADMEWATCDCDWALRGNLCKHQVKGMIMGGISIETILHRGVDMYNTMIADGTPHIEVKKGFQNLQSSMAENMASSDLQDMLPISNERSERDNVEEPMESVKSDSLADYSKDPSSSLVPPTSIELIFDIQSLIAQSLKLARDDLSLLQHVQRSSSQMLISLQAYKACQSTMLSHPIEEFTDVEDGLGTSLVCAKPIIEAILQKKRKKMTITKNKADEQAVQVEPFPLLPRRKRISLQSVLDKQACGEDLD